MMSYRYIGVVHVHSSFSDGTGSIEEICDAAHAAGLDFVVITDHNNLQAKNYEGWYKDVLVLAGEEVTRPEGNHMLAFNVVSVIPPHVSPQDGILMTKAQGGYAFLAHPFYKGNVILADPPLPWKDWQVQNFDGLEIWNLTADLYQTLASLNVDRPPPDPLKFARPNAQALHKWDELVAKGVKVIGLAGLDAHAERVECWGGAIILPYEMVFRALRLHVFTPVPLTKRDFEKDKALLYQAIASGQFLIGFDYVNATNNTDIVYELKKRAIKIIVNGTETVCARCIQSNGVVTIKTGKVIVFNVNDACARIEIIKNGKIAILTNYFP